MKLFVVLSLICTAHDLYAEQKKHLMVLPNQEINNILKDCELSEKTNDKINNKTEEITASEISKLNYLMKEGRNKCQPLEHDCFIRVDSMALEIAERCYGSNHPLVATCLTNLAETYSLQIMYSDAEPLLKRALAIRCRAYGYNNTDVANSIAKLASNYNNQHNYVKALPLYIYAIKSLEKTKNYDPLFVTLLYIKVAGIYRKNEQYADAEVFYKRALVIREKMMKQKRIPSLILIPCLDGLGELYFSQGLYSEAELQFMRSLAIWEKQPKGIEPKGIAPPDSLVSLAVIYSKQGNYTAAEPLFKRAIEYEEPSSLSFCLASLAANYNSQGRYLEAESLYKRAMVITESLGKAYHPQLTEILMNLASIYRVTQQYDEANNMEDKAASIRANEP